MEVTNSTSTASKSDYVAEGSYDPYEDLGFEEFIDLLVAELTNQDPMEPMTNSELMNQIGQIREIASTDQLTNTLDAVMLGQTLATAGNVVNKVVDGMTDEGNRLCGEVVSVALEDGEALLQVEDMFGETHSVNLNNISNIYPEGTSLPTPGYLEFLAGTAVEGASGDSTASQEDTADVVEGSETESDDGTASAEDTANETADEGGSQTSSEDDAQAAA